MSLKLVSEGFFYGSKICLRLGRNEFKTGLYIPFWIWRNLEKFNFSGNSATLIVKKRGRRVEKWPVVILKTTKHVTSSFFLSIFIIVFIS